MVINAKSMYDGSGIAYSGAELENIMFNVPVVPGIYRFNTGWPVTAQNWPEQSFAFTSETSLRTLTIAYPY
jgi:hypothetical protein